MTLVLVAAVPLASAAFLALAGGRLGPRTASAIGTAAIAFSFGVALAIAQAFAAGKTSLVAELGAWLPLRGADLALRADTLSVPLLLMLTGISALIALASVPDAAAGRGTQRYYVVLDLAVFAMVLVVLARDLVLLLAGWELLGVCGALLVAHRRELPAAAAAGVRSLVVGRVGDAAFLVGTLAMLALFRTVDIEQISGRLATITLTEASQSALLAASLLLVVAALARSAQLPLHAWSADPANAPATASAFLHAAVGASGVVLLLRLSPSLHPAALLAASAIGAITAIVAMTVALAQHDLRRALAWASTSQLGVLVTVAGLRDTSAALLALLAYLLFMTALGLGASAIARATDGETDLHRLGGLARRLPLAALGFAAGAASLAALPGTSAWAGITAIAADGPPLVLAAVLVTVSLGAILAGRLAALALLGDPRSARAQQARGPGAILVGTTLVAAAGALFFGALVLAGAVPLAERPMPALRPAVLVSIVAVLGALAGLFGVVIVLTWLGVSLPRE